jgi:hypothetical protein
MWRKNQACADDNIVLVLGESALVDQDINNKSNIYDLDMNIRPLNLDMNIRQLNLDMNIRQLNFCRSKQKPALD